MAEQQVRPEATQQPKDGEKPAPILDLSEKEHQQLAGVLSRINMTKIRVHDLNGEIESKQDELKATLAELNRTQAGFEMLTGMLAATHNIPGRFQFSPDLKRIIPAVEAPAER